MKDLITSIGSILVLMMFLLQFAANQASYTKMMGTEHTLKEFSLLSAGKGSIKDEDIHVLKNNLSEILSCSPSEISVKVTEYSLNEEDTEKCWADYSVTVPVYGVIGPAGLMGLTDSENVKKYTARGMVVFEREESP